MASSRREFLQLAKTYDLRKPPRAGYDIGGWYCSEKLDGQRCLWDGGVTRGMPTINVPWASTTNPKTLLKKTKIRPEATGLWSRYGNPIIAPNWFLNGLPSMPMDGELFAGRGNFQQTMSAVRKDAPVDSEWKNIQFAVYGSPPLESLFQDGEIRNANYVQAISWLRVRDWLASQLAKSELSDYYSSVHDGATFQQELTFLDQNLENQTDFAYLHHQIRLPATHDEAAVEVENQLAKVMELGGEGVIIRDPKAVWTPKRMAHILKCKPSHDDEAVVVGFTAGRAGKTGLMLGKIGALITEYNGQRLEISGMTHAEREFASDADSAIAKANPGGDLPANTQGAHFKVGERITFKFRELSTDGIPKEARYFRKRK
jgi:DNA ligase-1